MNKDFYKGTKEQVSARLQEAKQNKTFPNETVVASVSGGVDNIFSILDENGDGVISDDEIEALAAADTEEFADKDDETFSIRDFETVYNNVVSSDGATYLQVKNFGKYSFKDGTIETVTKDENGNVINKYSFKKENNDIREVSYNYDAKYKHETVRDAQGKTKYEKYDSYGEVNDRTITRTFDKDGKVETEKIETAGRIITKKYNKDNTAEYKTELKYNSDGVIGDTKQKNLGDCWILAGVNGLRDIPKGAEAIKDAIKQNPNGSITVTLKGVKRSYTFTPEEIGAHEYVSLDKKYSIGDVDMNLIEMAITKYRQELVSSDKIDRSPDDPSKGGWPGDTIQYLTGTKYKYKESKRAIKGMINDKQKFQDNNVVTVVFKQENKSLAGGKIITNHAYHIKRVTEDTVYVVNPHDSSKEIVYPKDEFLNNVKGASLTYFK